VGSGGLRSPRKKSLAMRGFFIGEFQFN